MNPGSAASPADGARVAVIGGGTVGARTARELVSPPQGPTVALWCARADRVATLREAFGSEVTVVHDPDRRGPDAACRAEVAVLSGTPEAQVEVARTHLGAGRHVISTSDRPEVVEGLLALDPLARASGRSVVVGAAFSPGLSCLLAARAAGSLDEVDEIHVARHGAGGPLCARHRLEAMRATTREWRDGVWVPAPSGSGRELCWFPDPVGARDCYRVATGEARVLVDAMPALRRATVRMAMSRRDRLMLPLPVLGPMGGDGVGALRVEVRGARGGSRRAEVLGVLDRPAMVAGAVAAVAAEELLAGRAPVGAHGLAAWADPGRMLRSLRERGVRVATLGGE